jgi:hypothetical protein
VKTREPALRPGGIDFVVGTKLACCSGQTDDGYRGFCIGRTREARWLDPRFSIFAPDPCSGRAVTADLETLNAGPPDSVLSRRWRYCLRRDVIP